MEAGKAALILIKKILILIGHHSKCCKSHKKLSKQKFSWTIRIEVTNLTNLSILTFQTSIFWKSWNFCTKNIFWLGTGVVFVPKFTSLYQIYKKDIIFLYLKQQVWGCLGGWDLRRVRGLWFWFVSGRSDQIGWANEWGLHQPLTKQMQDRVAPWPDQNDTVWARHFIPFAKIPFVSC